MAYNLSVKSLLGMLIAFLFIYPSSTQTGPPVFDKAYETVYLEEKTFAEILCTATGEPPIAYGWFDQSEDEILNGSSIFSVSNENSCTLFFDLVQRDHAAIYTCKARNVHGLVSKFYEIHVNPVSENETTVSIDKVTVKSVTERSVEFVIETTGDFEIIRSRFQERREGADYYKSFKKGEKIEYTGLSQAGNYTFRFQAETANKNLTDWFVSDYVVLFPDTPEVILRSLNDGVVKMEFSLTVDERMRGTIDKYTISYYTVSMREGKYWDENSCQINIDVPTCYGWGYTISNLQRNVYYILSVKGHTEAGYGKPYKHKIYTG